MANFKNWVSACRPRTLFLAVAAAGLGSGLAAHQGTFDGGTFLLTLLLAASIQILSNLANDWGDYEKGTDITGKREGPQRAMQSGNISRKQMKKAIAVAVVASAISGLAAVFYSFKWRIEVLPMLALGLLCILSAIFYTMGKYAYGYRGLGDVFAFLFFGPVAVIGTYYLHVHTLGFEPVLPAVGMGFISAMVLNINNMRDIENDRASGKITLAVRLGLQNAKFYHTLLTFGLFACFLQYSFLYAPSPWYRYLYTAVFLFQMRILSGIRTREARRLDSFLKPTVLWGFILAVAFSICINV